MGLAQDVRVYPKLIGSSPTGIGGAVIAFGMNEPGLIRDAENHLFLAARIHAAKSGAECDHVGWGNFEAGPI